MDAGSEPLVGLLLGAGLSAIEEDSRGLCPLAIYLSGKAPLSKTLFNPAAPNPLTQYDPIFEALAKAGADMNAEYPEETFKPVYGEASPYKTRVGINYVRQLAHTDCVNSAS